MCSFVFTNAEPPRVDGVMALKLPGRAAWLYLMNDDPQ
jgi:hypothetical protein